MGLDKARKKVLIAGIDHFGALFDLSGLRRCDPIDAAIDDPDMAFQEPPLIVLGENPRVFDPG
jgi:hypothetical protein